jgi:hypothetical protein
MRWPKGRLWHGSAMPDEPVPQPPHRSAAQPPAAKPSWAERARRLWQPRHRLFWPMLLFNLLGAACAWALRSLPLNTAGLLLVAFMGLMNAAFGLWAAWALSNSAPARQPSLFQDASGPGR